MLVPLGISASTLDSWPCDDQPDEYGVTTYVRVYGSSQGGDPPGQDPPSEGYAHSRTARLCLAQGQRTRVARL